MESGGGKSDNDPLASSQLDNFVALSPQQRPPVGGACANSINMSADSTCFLGFGTEDMSLHCHFC
jgi:hypothetical protein